MTAPRLLAFNDLEGAFDRPRRVGRLAGLIAALRDDRTVVCGAGDDTALGTLALLDDAGRGVARPFFEAVEPDAETLGNHDLDPGLDWATDWAGRAPTTYCCANVDWPLPASTTVDTAAGTVGVVGVVHPDTDAVCAALPDVDVGDPVAAVARDARRLRERGVDRVVALAHCGTHDRAVAAGTDVDAVVGGHVHERIREQVDGTALVRTAGGGAGLAEVRLGDPPTATVHDVAESRVAEDVAETYRARRADTGADEAVASLREPVARSGAERPGGESRAGNFLADAVRREAGADVAMFPAGSLRAGPPLADTVTTGDVVSLAPFDDAVHGVAISGAGLRRALDGAGADHPGDRGWVHAHLSGARARWDRDGALVDLTVGGDPVADDERYVVGTTGWFVYMDDAVDPVAPDAVVDSYRPIYEAALAHARDGGLAAAGLEGRIARADDAR